MAYLIFFAEQTFETETQWIIRENSSSSMPAISGLSTGLLGVRGNSGYEEALILQNYLESPAFVQKVKSELPFAQHYRGANRDFVRRFSGEESVENIRRYFRRFIDIQVSSDTGLITVRVRAFSPEFAKDLALYLVEQSEERINEINQRMFLSQTSVAEEELRKNEERLRAVRGELVAFQLERGVLDPASEAAARFAGISAIDSRLVEARSRLRVQSQFLSEGSVEIRQLRNEVSALEEQRFEEMAKLLGEGDEGMAGLLRHYDDLKLRLELASSSYNASFATLESARQDAARQEKFILEVSPPQLAGEPVFPRAFYHGFIALVLIGLVSSLGKLVLATIRDHTI